MMQVSRRHVDPIVSYRCAAMVIRMAQRVRIATMGMRWVTGPCENDELCTVCGRECSSRWRTLRRWFYGCSANSATTVIDTGNGCSSDCQKNNTCGDGVLEAIFEICDDGYTDACGDCNEDCSAVGTGYALVDDGGSPTIGGWGDLRAI